MTDPWRTPEARRVATAIRECQRRLRSLGLLKPAILEADDRGHVYVSRLAYLAPCTAAPAITRMN